MSSARNTETDNQPEQRNEEGKKKIFARGRFQGREPKLRGHTYELTYDQNPQQFIKTTKEIANYIGHTHKKHARALAEAVGTLNLEDPVTPAAPDPNDPVAFKIWKQQLRDHSNVSNAYDDFLGQLYHIVLGQCTDALQDQIRAHPNYNNANGDGIALLRIIKTLIYSFEEGQDLSDALCNVKTRFYRFHQKPDMIVMDEVGIQIVDPALAMQFATAEGRDEPNDADIQSAKEKMPATMFIRGPDPCRYYNYLQDLRNKKLQNVDAYPTTVQEAYYVLQRWNQSRTAKQSHRDGVAFAQNNDDQPHRGPICYNCNQPGHYVSNCPLKSETNQRVTNENGTQGMTNLYKEGTVLTNTRIGDIPPTWVLLDSQSTVSVFHNASMLTNLWQVNTTMMI